MKEFLPANANKIMSWKNGLGSTVEIVISPDSAVFADGQFDYRLSSATVTQEGPFSKFPGYDRWLCVIAGEGLKIGSQTYRRLQPFHFSGEDDIVAAPAQINGSILDLGLIYRRDHFTAQMRENLGHDKNPFFCLHEGVHFIFCVQGVVKIADTELKKGDVLKLAGSQEVSAQFFDDAQTLQISLQKRI